MTMSLLLSASILKKLSGRAVLVAAGVAALGLGGCASVPPAPAQPEAPSLASSAQPVYLRITKPDGTSQLLRVDSKTWWSSGERGGSVGRKVIEQGRPHLIFLDMGLVSTHYSLLALDATLGFSVGSDKQGSRMELRNKTALGFNADSAWLAICPAQIAAPKRSDCLFSDELSYELQNGNGSLTTLSSVGSRKPAFLFLALNTVGAGQSVAVEVPDQAEAHQQFQARYAEFRKRDDAQRLEARKRAELEAKRAREAAERQEAEARKFLVEAKRGSTLFCRSFSLLPAGGLTSQVVYTCDRTGDSLMLGVHELLGLGWTLINETRLPTPGVLGVGYAVTLTFRKG